MSRACIVSACGLTGDPDVGLTALGGSRGAPGHTLTPEILQTEQFLHLLTGDLDTGLPNHQTYRQRDRVRETSRFFKPLV